MVEKLAAESNLIPKPTLLLLLYEAFRDRESESWPVPTTSNSNQLLKKGEHLSRKLPYRVSILVEKEMNASNSKLQLLGFLKQPKISRRALSFLGAKICLRLKKSAV